MTSFYAQPYDISATGFYFEDAETYHDKSANLVNSYGHPVEEFEIQFIDGATIDAELFRALSVNQSTILKFIDLHADWDEHEKCLLIIAAGECGYNFDFETGSPHDFEVDLYELDSLKDLACQFVEEGLFGETPEKIAGYLDYDLIARDLGMDYAEITIAGSRYVYRCG